MGVVTSGCRLCSNFIILRNASAVSFATSTLDFVLRGLDGPIVFANSRLPVNVLQASKGRGLVATVRVTTTGRGNIPIIPRIYVFFRGSLLENGHADGVGTSGFGTFHSCGCPPLTRTNVCVGCSAKRICRPISEGPLGPRCLLSQGVTILGLFPKVSPRIIRDVLGVPKLGKIIVRAFKDNGTPYCS